MMKSRNVAGILIVPSSSGCIGHLKELQARGIPVVILDRTFPGLTASEVMVENREGASKAVNHLLDHGHSSILCVGYDSQFNSVGQRIEGYESAMLTAGLKPQFLVLGESSLIGPSSGQATSIPQAADCTLYAEQRDHHQCSQHTAAREDSDSG